MLTKEIISGFNLLSLAGFAVMGLTLALNRTGRAGKALSIGLIKALGAAILASQTRGFRGMSAKTADLRRR